MALKDNFSNPKGLIGRLMLSGMNMGHSPMSKWTFEHIKAAPDADVADAEAKKDFKAQEMQDFEEKLKKGLHK